MTHLLQEMERTVSLQRNSLKAGQPPGSPLFGAEPEDDDADAQEVEMVLETYFMHIDNTYNKLQTLTEYIDDTEVSPPTGLWLVVMAGTLTILQTSAEQPANILACALVQDYINIELDNQRNQLIRVSKQVALM